MTSRFQIVLAKDFLWQLFLPDIINVDLVIRQYISNGKNICVIVVCFFWSSILFHKKNQNTQII